MAQERAVQRGAPGRARLNRQRARISRTRRARQRRARQAVGQHLCRRQAPVRRVRHRKEEAIHSFCRVVAVPPPPRVQATRSLSSLLVPHDTPQTSRCTRRPEA